ncbi:Sodium/hydrogen exchanger family-domain-containing protein [Lipomyces arxii]|uniref:Sodium/hydrogen exchanger family-domain-containing protein n=1 Tax=Lipomyces arxii TaxID=56418 RepID=UPI0034CDBAC2
MAWEQLWIDKAHLAYAIIGGFTTIFSLISLFVKEKLYIGEATVATIVGIIFGPHALNLFDPSSWGNVDYITLEISRIVLIVQIFAVAVELPKKYMLRHWLSVFYLLVPVMTFGWLISSVFIWKLVPSLRWVDSLVVAACITATDPVLASAVVGKGKFSKRVPGHLRNLLSAESGCNDGMAFPFTYLSLYLVREAGHAGEIVQHWITLTILYECVFGCILGALIGYSGRHLIKFAENHNLIDRESFLVFYFVLALFCTGVGSILGTDDLLVSFSAGAAFSWDGWFTRKTEESHVSNVIDLLLNLAYFVYFGSIVPWSYYNAPELSLSPWKLSILAILIILFRRIPVMLMLKPLVPDIRTWREALFCGHFGPIGVGAVFITILARAELEHDEPTPLAQLPPKGSPHFDLMAVMWPVVSFLIITSIIVHGSSIAVFTLGKRINTMAITMSYTTGNGNGPSWLQRLPRMDTGQSLSFRKVETSSETPNMNSVFRRKPAVSATKEEATVRVPARAAGRMSRPRKRKDAGYRREKDRRDEVASLEPAVTREDEATLEEGINEDSPAVYQEGPHYIVEDADGEVLTTINSDTNERAPWNESLEAIPDLSDAASSLSVRDRYHSSPTASPSRGGHDNLNGTHAIAYQLDDEIIVENEEGEVIRRYRINRHRPAGPGTGLDRALSWVGLRRGSTAAISTLGTARGAPSHPGDLEMQRIESSEPGASGSSSGSGLEKSDLPKNFLQRMETEDEAAASRMTRGRHMRADDDEETPAERKRRLAALQGSEGAETLAPARSRISTEGDDDSGNDYDYQVDVDEEEDEERSIRQSTERPTRISFAGENEIERRRRLAALGESFNDDETATGGSESAQSRGITWGANVKSSR